MIIYDMLSNSSVFSKIRLLVLLPLFFPEPLKSEVRMLPKQTD